MIMKNDNLEKKKKKKIMMFPGITETSGKKEQNIIRLVTWTDFSIISFWSISSAGSMMGGKKV